MDEWLENLRDALDHIDYGVVLLDRTLTSRFINRAFCEMWAFPQADANQLHSFARIMQHGYTHAHYKVDDVDAYVAERIARVEKGHDTRLLPLLDGRVIRFACIPLPFGGRMLTYADQTELVNTIQKLESVVNIDELTQIYNRRYLYVLGQNEVAMSRRYGRTLSVLMLDIDHFKRINDAHGHSVGDAVIRAVARSCREIGRSTDSAGRLGGEEFAVLLPETSLAAALQVGERLCSTIAKVDIWTGSEKVRVTISVGVAQWHDADAGFENLLRRADAALYAAKRSGRNRVCSAQEDPEPGSV